MGYLELDVLNANAPSRRALGIDLGTTNSLAAIWKDDRPMVLRTEGGSGIVPSVVNVPESGDPLVGKPARNQAVVDPTNTVFSVKRFMGRGLADIGDTADLPFAVSETETGLIQIEIHGRKYSPQELSALILHRVHTLALECLDGDEIRAAVITVPAYFDDTQRQATRDAARLAGIDVLRIINEPTAASLAYGLDQKGDGTVAVFDFGGGTFDISILSIEEGVFQVLATAGDTRLGGDDFDRALIDLAKRELSDRMSQEELSDPGFQQAARLAAERCKIALSTDPEHDLAIVIPESGIHWRKTVTRAEFEELMRPYIEKTLDACRRAVADSKVAIADIGEVILVGGSTRIPAVRKAVEDFFGRKPHTELNPDEVVALGAAAQAHVLVGGTRDILLMDVTPLSLGVETYGGAVSKIIMRNSTIPCSVVEGFTTQVDNQTGIDFHILQGERELADDCRTLGRFKLSGIPPMPAGMAKVAVRFLIDADGLLSVTAKEESTGVQASIDVQPMHSLTDEEVETMLADSITHAAEDFERRRIADLHGELETMLLATTKNMQAARDHLDRESMEDLDEAVAAAREAITSEDLKVVQAARDAFEQAALPLATVLMNDVVKQAITGKRLDQV